MPNKRKQLKIQKLIFFYMWVSRQKVNQITAIRNWNTTNTGHEPGDILL